MDSILFFTGHNMNPKRYVCYFPKINFIFDPLDYKLTDSKTIIVTHSVGIINALLFLSKMEIKLVKIIALDPPDISHNAIKSRYDKLSDDLKKIYDQYLKIKIREYNIITFRNKKNIDYFDKNMYEIHYYEEDTHYPYTIKKIRDKIIKYIS